MLKISIAGIIVEINNKYPTIEKLSVDYLSDGVPDFSVCATDEEIEREGLGLSDDFTSGELESIAIYRKIALNLSEYSAFVFHGAAVEVGGVASIFTAKSGVGKTTHVRLWLKKFGKEASVLNGDKPIIRIINGEPFVAGTPWRGKEGYGRPGLVPIAGVALLERASENFARPVSVDDALVRFLTQAYVPRHDARAASKTVAIISEVLAKIPIITLGCNMKDEAADVAYSAFLKVPHN